MFCSILFRIAEIPDVHLKLSSRTDVIEQCFMAANSPVHSTNTPVNVMIFLLCISRCQEAHQNLLKPALVDDIIELCEKNVDVHPSMETCTKALK